MICYFSCPSPLFSMEITAVLSPAPPNALACKQHCGVLPWSWCAEEWEQQEEAGGHTGLPKGEG